ncbi:MAG: class I SAM-dependent methyltransferase [Chloroflexota bacterium]
MRLRLPAALATTATGESDPIAFYRRPLVGQLYRRRIEMGLNLILPLAAGTRVLEVGYGAGVVLFNLAGPGRELHGIDLDADAGAVRQRLGSLGVRAALTRGSVVNMRGLYHANWFDLVVCFSVFEHLADPRPALDEIARVLKPGGTAIIGMPAVNPAMSRAFSAIGFQGIDRFHVTAPRVVWRLLRQRSRVARHTLPAGAPFPLALYTVFEVHF